MSIYKRLLLWLIPALILTTAISGTTIYMRTLTEVNEMQDYALRQTAYSMQYSNPDKNNYPNDDVSERAADNGDFELIRQIWDKNNNLIFSTKTGRNIPLFNTDGIATVSWGNQKWRVFSLISTGNVIQVVQPFDVREEESADIAESAALPAIILIPALVLLIFGGVAFGLRPLKQIASDLGNRHADSMEPLQFQELPEEIASMVLSLNALLKRLSNSMELQRQFIEDAAHELRTPLTALNLQTEIMSRSSNKDEISDALSNLKQGVTRSTHLVEQLLTLARQQHVIKQTPFEIIELEGLAKDVIAELAQIANSKNIDLGLASKEKTYIEGNKGALRTMLVNLVDNSIRYTPEWGKIDVTISTEENKSVLEISDSGAGIPLADRERVFDRFYRGLGHSAIGSGLGLAIVKSIADRHQAIIKLGEGKNGLGLNAKIEFVFFQPTCGRKKS